MKKVLFATTALVASAGFASAQGVSLSGSAEMGITGGDRVHFMTGVVTPGETQFHTDIDVTFTLSGTTDNGLTFGATIDLDEEGGFSATGGGPESVFISGGFGTLTMGDTDGAFDWAMNEVPAGSGSINDAETSHAGFSGNAGLDGIYDGQIARYDHSVGDLGFAISVELDDTGVRDAAFGIGIRYGVDMGGSDLEIALGYQTGEPVAGFDRTIMGISLDATFSDINVGLNYSTAEDDAWVSDSSHIGIGVAYSMDAFTFGINWGRVDNIMGVGGDDRSGWGLSAGYDLGGGASVLFGYGMSDVTIGGVSTDASNWSLGLSMSF